MILGCYSAAYLHLLAWDSHHYGNDLVCHYLWIIHLIFSVIRFISVKDLKASEIHHLRSVEMEWDGHLNTHECAWWATKCASFSHYRRFGAESSWKSERERTLYDFVKSQEVCCMKLWQTYRKLCLVTKNVDCVA